MYIEVKKKSNGKYEVVPNTIPTPSGGDEYNFYYWLEEDKAHGYYTMTENPSVGDNVFVESDSGGNPDHMSNYAIKAIGEGTITIEEQSEDIVLLRETLGDISFTKTN